MQLDDVATAFTAYVTARRHLLKALERPVSNRDPLAVVSERLMALLVGGQLAKNPVQKDYDLITSQGAKMQVRSLANPAGTNWPNGHVVHIKPGMDLYAVVFFVDLLPVTAIVFPPHLAAICERLNKKHKGDHDVMFTLTKGDYSTISEHSDEFKSLGVEVYDLASLFQSSTAIMENSPALTS